jgi:hypothetical protein
MTVTLAQTIDHDFVHITLCRILESEQNESGSSLAAWTAALPRLAWLTLRRVLSRARLRPILGSVERSRSAAALSAAGWASIPGSRPRSRQRPPTAVSNPACVLNGTAGQYVGIGGGLRHMIGGL